MASRSRPPIPDDEEERLAELDRYDILDTAPEPIYEDIIFLASKICGTKMAAISLVDEDRQWFKAKREIDPEETPREDAFCAHAIVNPEETMVVNDATQDERFADNPDVVDDPGIRFYAGSPLVTPGGRGLGTVCAIDDTPRELTAEQRRALEALSDMVMNQLELRRRSRELRDAKEGLEEMAQELKRSNEELDRFASVVSHELKDPLTQTVSNLDLLDLTVGEDLDEEARELLDEATRGGERMEHLIKDLLRYARAGGGDVEKETVDLEAVFEDMEAELQTELDATDATLTHDPLPEVEADRSLLRQCLQNLVGNALKYADKTPPEVHVGVEEDGELWRFTVEDDGRGIPEDEQDELFEIFQRASNTGETGGTGVGLALCARIVQRHDGEIGVDSTPGEGSTFTFTLPK